MVFFTFYNYVLFNLEVEIHKDFLFLLVLILVFVSRVRALWHFHYQKWNKSSLPERLWTISTCILAIFYLAGLVYIAECAGEHSGDGGSTSYSKPEWEIALDLPHNQVAPECVRSHIKQELMYLFNIGRKNTLSEKMFDKFIEPLALDEAKVAFAKELLKRINTLQLSHWNKGNHIPFRFGTRSERERLYSILWEYADKQD
jgi:hypothetical protein